MGRTEYLDPYMASVSQGSPPTRSVWLIFSHSDASVCPFSKSIKAYDMGVPCDRRDLVGGWNTLNSQVVSCSSFLGNVEAVLSNDHWNNTHPTNCYEYFIVVKLPQSSAESTSEP